MKKVIMVLMLMCVSISTLFLGGCSSPLQKQTPYTVVNGQDKVVSYLPETDQAVVDAKKIAQDFVKAYSSRDYKTDKGDTEYSFYTKEMLDGLVGANDQAKTLKFLTDNKIVSVVNGYSISSIKFKEDKDHCIVYGTESMTYKEASSNFLSTNGYKLNTTYNATFNITLVKTNGVWAVNGYESGKLK